jgi:hypothetical protein
VKGEEKSIVNGVRVVVTFAALGIGPREIYDQRNSWRKLLGVLKRSCHFTPNNKSAAEWVWIDGRRCDWRDGWNGTAEEGDHRDHRDILTKQTARQSSERRCQIRGPGKFASENTIRLLNCMFENGGVVRPGTL